MRRDAVLITKGSLVRGHEINVANILAKDGHDISFIHVSNMPTPDILMDGVAWEIKSPIGSGKRTIENTLRTALKQSENIILDLTRIKMSEENCNREIRKQLKKTNQIKRLMVINKDSTISRLR